VASRALETDHGKLSSEVRGDPVGRSIPAVLTLLMSAGIFLLAEGVVGIPDGR
jgi:hypothetical protein